MRKYIKLNRLSPMLGKKWCGNGDLEGMVFKINEPVLPTKVPVITSAIACRFMSYEDGFPHGLYIQDAGIPSFLNWYVAGKMRSPGSLKSTFVFGIRMLLRFFEVKIARSFKREINIGDDIRQDD